MTKRIISDDLRNQLEKRWQELKKPELLVMLKKADERVYQCLLTNPHQPILQEIKSMYIHGAPGVGKSVYAAWLMLEWSKMKALKGSIKQDAVFVNATELFQELRNCYAGKGNEFEIIEKYKNIDLLVLDDLGTTKVTEWVYQTLYLIVNFRYAHFKPTIITSNFSLDQLAALLMDDRIPSRIEHDCGEEGLICITNDSKRKQKK